jgi:putative tryptophan/tyrosine transport system substrate-binding protein
MSAFGGKADAATQTIPIVFMQAADAIRIGLVDSLNRPGGNVAGTHLMWAKMAGKRVQLSRFALSKDGVGRVAEVSDRRGLRY